MTILLAALSALSLQASDGYPEATPVREGSAPLSIWMNNDRRYREGDRVRLQVDADVTGFLLVLNYDPSGRLRVLFPFDPRDDTRVTAGRRYEVRADNYDGAFRASGEGAGLVFSAISPEPWRLEEITLADRWDLTRLEIDVRSDDPEPEITSLVQRLSGPAGFDYDVMGYRVYGEETYSTSYNTYVYPGRPVYVYDDYWYCNNWSWRYDGCHRWPGDGGWFFGLGFYNPYYYGYNHYPYRYRYGYGWTRPSFPVNRGSVIAGRPRGYTVVPRGGFGTNRNDGIGSRTFGGNRSSGDGRSVGAPARGPNSGSGAVSPPARRNPAREYSRPESRGGDARGAPPARARSPRTEPSRGSASPAREYSRPSESRPDTRSAPPARARGGDRSEPSRRDASAAREPSRRDAPAARSQPSRRDPPAARAEPSRRESPPAQARSGNGSGNRGNGGGGASQPTRSRGGRPRGGS